MSEERTDLAHLRALAEGARDAYEDEAGMMTLGRDSALEAYVQALPPDVLLALLDRLERVEGALAVEYDGCVGATDRHTCIGCIRQDAKAAQRAATWEEIRHLPGCALRGEP